MNIAPLASESSSLNSTGSTGESSFPTPKQTLGADDFMKILMTQLTAQDPMNPMKDTEFIAQMANFSSLEQMRTLSQSFTTYSNDQKMAAAPSYLGCEVTVKDAANGDITGIVDAITATSAAPPPSPKAAETAEVKKLRRHRAAKDHSVTPGALARMSWMTDM